VGGDTVFDFGNGTLLILHNVMKSNLHANDLLFV
jgi:hypothetical protein